MATASEHVAREYVDEDGLAERYLIRPRTAQRWRATGDGPPFVRLGRRRVLYRVVDVEAWLAQRTFKHLAEETARKLSEVTSPKPETRNPATAQGTSKQRMRIEGGARDSG